MILTKPEADDNLKKIIFNPKGDSTKAKIFILGGAPSSEDSKRMEIFAPDTELTAELYNALEVNNINFNDVFLSTACKYDLKGKKVSAKDIKACHAYLEEELLTVKPKLIITLGAEAFKRVLGKNTKVGDYIGELIDCPYNCKLLANHSPGTVVAVDPTKRNEFIEIFELAKRYVDDNLHYEDFEYIVIDNVEDAKTIVQHYIDNECFDIGYDCEWRGTHWYDDEVLYTVQFCCEEHKAVIFDISKDGITENLELLQTLRPLLEHPKVRRMGWAIRQDDKRLVKRGFNLTDETLCWDGMKAMAFFDSRWSKGLEVGIRKFTNYPPYYNKLNLFLKENKISKSDMSIVKFEDPDLFYHYCAGDAVSHRMACLNQIKQFPEQHEEYFSNIYMPMSNYLLDLEISGIPIDKEVIIEITKKYQDKYVELLIQLKEKLKVYGIEDFNPNAHQQKKHLVFDILKADPVYYTKKGTTKQKPSAWYNRQTPFKQKQYSPSTNGKSLSTMVFDLQDKVKTCEIKDKAELESKLAVLKNLLDLNRISVFANKFLSQKGLSLGDEPDDDDEESLKQSYWAAIRSDGKIHADFFECLKNFRSSSTPNVQNPASKALAHVPGIFFPEYNTASKERRKELDIFIPKNIRNIFCSGNSEMLYLCADVASADLGIMSFISQDQDFIHDIRTGGFHELKMKEYFQDSTLNKNDNVSQYVITKGINFACSYTCEMLAAAEPIQAQILAESGLHVDIDRIEYALNTWNRYERYMAWREECKDMVKTNQYIENARGMKLYFENTDNFSIQAGYLNESLAYPVASELALFVYNVCINIKNYCKDDGIWMNKVRPINIIHDDIQFVFHESLMENDYFPEVVKYWMTEGTRLCTGDKLGTEVNIGRSWKGKEKIFSKETHWSTKENCWKW